MFSQALETSGFTGRPQDTLINDKVPALTRATLPAPRLTENGSGGVPPLAPPKRPPDNKPTQPPMTKTISAGANNSPSPQSLPPATSASKSSQGLPKPSRIHYPLVAPSLSDTSDYDEVGDDAETGPKRLSPSLVAQFEAQFEEKKLQIRIDKIREFHQLACDADAQLCVNLANGRRGKTLTRQEEGKMVEVHYQWTVSLRERMEKERKEQVKQEQRRLRNELTRRNPVSSAAQGPRQGRVAVPASQESDTDTEDELRQKLERIKQEQQALQAKYASFEPAETVAQPHPHVARKRAGTLTAENVAREPAETMAQPHVARKRAGTLTAENAPSAAARGPSSAIFESDHGSTPKPSGSAWSVKPAPRGLSNILNNVPKKTASPFDFTDPTTPLASHFDVDSIDQEADNEDDDDDEQEKENAGFWSYLSAGQKKKAVPPVPAAPSPWNFAGPPRAPQKPLNGKSRLGLVTSASDDGNSNSNDVFENEDTTGPKEAEKEVVESPQDKTPVIASAPAPNVPSNKKQTKKQRSANNKKAGTGKAEAAAPQQSNKTEANANPPPAQKGPQKSAPVGVPNKAGTGKKADDISSTPRPSVLKRLQAQLANEEAGNDDDDNSPTTPRPTVSKKPTQVGHNNNNNNSNPWARGVAKGASSALSHSGFGKWSCALRR